ncbi:MAG: hypothetical protein NZ839_00195 [Endomicrobia bacterium]|nr:hypothetical protein [Endomicrobiia bacterium]
MKEILAFIIILIILVILIKLIVKITSFLAKVVIWIVIVVIGFYFLNYYILPKIGVEPLPVKKYIYDIIKSRNKTIKKQINTVFKHQIQPQVKRVIEEKDKIIKHQIQKLTTGFFTK